MQPELGRKESRDGSSPSPGWTSRPFDVVVDRHEFERQDPEAIRSRFSHDWLDNRVLASLGARRHIMFAVRARGADPEFFRGFEEEISVLRKLTERVAAAYSPARLVHWCFPHLTLTRRREMEEELDRLFVELTPIHTVRDRTLLALDEFGAAGTALLQDWHNRTFSDAAIDKAMDRLGYAAQSLKECLGAWPRGTVLP